MEAFHRPEPALSKLLECVLDRLACDELHVVGLRCSIWASTAQIDEKQFRHRGWGASRQIMPASRKTQA